MVLFVPRKLKKHVLCEKPLDITLEKIDAMTAACESAHVRLGCAFQHRTAAHNRAAYEAVQSGKLGKIYIANTFLKKYRGQEYYDKWGPGEAPGSSTAVGRSFNRRHIHLT